MWRDAMNARFRMPMTVFLLGAAMGLSALAADQNAGEKGTTQNAAPANSNLSAMMQEMRTQMAAIKAEKDPAKRAKLMNAHMTNMHTAMQELQKNGGCAMNGMMGGNMMNGMSGAGGMNMMQMMMEQMEEHQKAMQGAAE
jgi:hypothetical protein